MKEIVLFAALMIVCAGATAYASKNTSDEKSFSPQAPKELQQFAFWLGEWEFTNKFKNSDGSNGESVGRNRVSVTFDGWGVLENFTTGNPDKPYHGGSITIYNSTTKKFSQSYTDSQGYVMTFVGKWADNQMVLYSPELEQNGQKYQTRLIWKNIKKETMDWTYERSNDNGKTWQSLWDIAYRRIK